jgi:hypothetical protein
MNIHPLWFLCLFTRCLLIFLIWYLINYKNSKIVKTVIMILLVGIGLGFIRKAYFGSNNEKQVAKVFWHEARYVHGILYILASSYLFYNNLNMCLLLLLLDVIFSVLYRIILDK